MTASKSVWIVNQYAGSRHHGMEYRHFYLGRELVAKGYDVTIVSGSFSHLFTNPPVVDSTITIEALDGIRYCWLRIPRYTGVGLARAFNMVTYALKLLSPKLRGLPRPGTIIVSSPSPLPILPATLLAKRYRAQLVFEVRDIWPLTLVELGWRSRLSPLVAVMGWLERFAYRRADWVASPLPNALAHMSRYGVGPERFSYVPNGVALSEFDEAKPLSPATREQLPSGKFVVGYVGTMGPANALQELVRAAAVLRGRTSIEFVLVGTGRSKETLRTVAEELRLDNIRFLDPVPREEVPAVLGACDALFVGLQRSELYHFGISPNKLFDYMYSGTPIVQAIPGGVNDLVAAAGCGITVEAENAEAIAHAVAEIAAMPASERERLGRNGRRFVAENHSYAVLADRYIELMNGRTPAPPDANLAVPA
jgi:glycosyltransferase involved in cell wall biosynthesis